MRKINLRLSLAIPLVAAIFFSGCSDSAKRYIVADKLEPFETVKFESGAISVTADMYRVDDDKTRPFIILCHQAGWSRGEYREIAPKLNELGFNCLAIDQRSGKAVNNIPNDTVAEADAASLPTDFPDAEQDIIAAIKHVREAGHDGKLILWGSSYSAALVLRVAGQHPEMVDGVLAFAPGEYFERFGKPADWITSSAATIADPSFITSAKEEYDRWSAIHEAIPGEQKVKFVPETNGNHGSRALWDQFDDSDAYWEATKAFLNQYVETKEDQ